MQDLRRRGLATFAAVWLSLSCAPAPKPQAAPAPPTAVPAPTATPRAYAYPAARKGGVVDDYHGTKVADPFRELENADDPATIAWVDAENALTRRLLDTPVRAQLKEQLTKLADYPKTSIPTRRGQFYFFFKNSGLQNQAVYYVQKGLHGQPRVLLDPNALAADGTAAVTSFEPTQDGRLLGYAISRSGSDWQEIYVRDVATGKDLPDKLQWCKFSGVAWTKDGRGFYYTRHPQPGTVPAGDEHYFPKICFHRLGDPQEKDRLVYERPEDRQIGLTAAVTWDGRWLILYAFRGASNKTEVRIVDLKTPGFKPALLFPGFADGYSVAEIVGGRLYCWTDRDAPMGRVVAVELSKIASGRAEPAPFREVVAQGKDRLDTAAVIGRRLVLSYLHDASGAVRIHGLDGRLQQEVPLPGIGEVDALSGEPDDTEMFLSFVTFTTPATNYRYEFAKRALTVFQKAEFPIDTSPYETEQVWYPSRDGTQVSMFLIHRKGLPKDGNRPVYLTGYGGFQISTTPYFTSSFFPFLAKNGLIATPNLRGGGDYGEAWHVAGMREKKQNVFDDFIAAAEWLIRDGWTKTPRLAIEGGSNGGLLVSAVMNQRPELFGAVVCQVPVADMLRFPKFTVGRYWIPEYGDADQASDFPFLYKYSPLHNVRDGTVYPSALITTADTDDRVAPGHAKKLTARLQEADAGPNPILLRVETKAGHGGGKPLTKKIDESADIWTFVFWRLGIH